MYEFPEFLAASVIITAVIIVSLICSLLLIVPSWKILERMGYSGAWSLLLLISPFHIILLFYLAFNKWPMELSPTKNQLKND